MVPVRPAVVAPALFLPGPVALTAPAMAELAVRDMKRTAPVVVIMAVVVVGAAPTLMEGIVMAQVGRKASL